MGRFMVATFTDLILRVGMAIVLSGTELGSTGIWLSWPIGWCIGTVLSIVFYATAIRKALGQPSHEKRGRRSGGRTPRRGRAGCRTGL